MVAGTLWIASAGVVLLAILAALQVYLAARFRRLVSPALAAAFLAALVLAAGGASGLLAAGRAPAGGQGRRL